MAKRRRATPEYRKAVEIAPIANLPTKYVYRILAGKWHPSLHRLQLIAFAMGKTLHETAAEIGIVGKAPPQPAKITPAMINRSELGRRSKVHFTYVSKVVNGRRTPSVKTLGALAKALETTLDELVAAFRL